MRALWQVHGKPGGKAAGYVDRPYTMDDLKRALAEVSGDAAFAGEFFSRYVQGHEVVDYKALLARAGFVVRPVPGSGAFIGSLRLEDAPGGVRVAALVPMGSPAFDAGLEREDVIVAVGGAAVTSEADLRKRLVQGKPGDELPIAFERRGERVSSTIRLAEDPRREVVPVEDTGQSLTPLQKRFRDAWLGSAGR
jgi:predicted metalloprotease with PDZ domain